MKRFAVLAMAVVLSVLFTACSDSNKSNIPEKQTTAQTTERESTKNTKSTKETTTKESTTKSTPSTEKTTRESDTQVETIFEETSTDFDDLFEEGTVSNGSGEGVIDQIGDDLMR